MQDLLSAQELYNSFNNNSNNCYKQKGKVLWRFTVNILKAFRVRLKKG